MSGYIEGISRDQATLFPDRLEDWIDEDHPARVIEAFVDAMDLAGAGFGRMSPAQTGRPCYHPSVLLKLFIYGYLNRIPSSRRLEREAGRNVEAMWLTAAIKGKRDRHKALLDELDRSGEDQISLTNPDARAMARMTKVAVGYNVQLAVDVKHKLIAEQEVSSQVVDMGLLTQTTEAAMDNLGVDEINVVADRGYFKVEDIEACEKAGITAYVPKPLRGAAVREGFFSKDEFRYDAETDVYISRPDSVFLHATRKRRVI